MIKQFLMGVVLASLFIYPTVGITQAAEISTEMKEQAVESSLLWSSVVDQGQYEQSWQETDDLFKQSVPKEQWIKQLTDVRQPLGEVKSRTVYDTGYFGNIPNHPDMEMIVVQFQTSFQNKPLAYETISSVRVKGGPWKIAGYYIADAVDIKSQ